MHATEPPPRVRGSLLARNALVNLAGLLIPLIVAFVTLPLMISGLGAERFGVLSIVWLLLTYLSELGFGTAATRYTADAIGAGRTHELGAVLWTTAALQTAVALIPATALVIATPWLVDSALNIPAGIENEARMCLYLLAGTLPVLGWARSFRGLVDGAQRFDLSVAVHLPVTAGSYIVAAIGAQSGWSLTAVMWVIVGSRLLSIPAFYLVARRALPGVSLRPVIEPGKFRELASFTGWVTVSTLISPLLLYLDRFMVGVLLSMAAVTFYAAPYEIIARLALIPGALIGALFPALSQLSARTARSEAEQLAARCIVFLVALLGPACVLIVGGARDGLALWLGPDYANQSATAVQILAWGLLTNAIAHVPYALLHSTGRPDLPARFHVIELPLQLLLAWVLISRFGVTGAALAWSARMTIDALLLFAAAARLKLLHGSTLRELSKPRMALSLLVSAVLAIAISITNATPAFRLVMTAVIALACAAMLWMGAVSVAERRRIIALFRPAAS